MVGEINWGILDPNAAAKAAGSFQQGQANRLAMEQEKQTQAANALALQRGQQSAADENAMRQAYAQSGGDANKLVESLRSVGLHQKAMELQGQIASQQAAAKKQQIQDALDHYKVVDQTISGAKDQTGWSQARQKLANIYGPESIANIPEQYDPSYVESAKQQGLTIKDRLDQEWKAADLQQKQFQFGKTQELERAKMGQAERHYQGTQALEREKLGTKAGGEKPLTESQAKATTYASQMNEASNAMDALEQGGLDLSRKSTQGLVGMAGGVANPLVPADAQQYKQAQNQWSESFLRVKTGAAATKEEVELNNKTFFPQMGDDAKTIERKRQARTAAERDVLNMAAGGKEKVTPRQERATSAHPPEINDLLKKYGS